MFFFPIIVSYEKLHFFSLKIKAFFKAEDTASLPMAGDWN